MRGARPRSLSVVLYHIVLVTLRDDVSDAQVDLLLEGFAGLPAAIPEIRTYDFGREAGISPNEFGVVLVATFDSVDDLLTYREHPAHRSFRQDLLVPIAREITATQFVPV